MCSFHIMGCVFFSLSLHSLSLVCVYQVCSAIAIMVLEKLSKKKLEFITEGLVYSIEVRNDMYSY
jgi:hypothetical protein